MLAADILIHAVRRLWRQPGDMLTCVFTLAVGFGTALASLAMVKHAFFDALPYASPRLMTVWTSLEGQTSVVSAHVFEEFREQSKTFSRQTAFRQQTVTTRRRMAPSGSRTCRFRLVLHGVRREPGAGPRVDAGRAEEIVLTWPWWQRAFGGSAAAVGQSITIDGAARRITGVMPPDFVAPFDPAAQFLIPLDIPALLREPRARRNVTVVGRLVDGATPAQLDAELGLFTAQLQSRLPVIHGRQAFVSQPLREALIGIARPIILATAGGAALLMLVVAANVGGLSAARAVGVRRESWLRAALGAERQRLLLEQVAEAGMIGALGCAAGTAIAQGLVRVAASYQPSFLPRMEPVVLGAESIAIGWASGLLVCAVAVLVPHFTMMSLRSGAGDMAQSAARSTAGHARLRSALVTLQVAFALSLMVGAGLSIRTVYHLATLPLGYDASRVVTFPATLAGPKYRDAASHMAFERAVLERIEQLPGVVSASVGGPLAGGMGASLTVFGQPQPDGRPEIGYISVSPGFLRTYGMRLVEGRDLLPTDTVHPPPVVLINETMARRFWPDGTAARTCSASDPIRTRRGLPSPASSPTCARMARSCTCGRWRTARPHSSRSCRASSPSAWTIPRPRCHATWSQSRVLSIRACRSAPSQDWIRSSSA